MTDVKNSNELYTIFLFQFFNNECVLRNYIFITMLYKTEFYKIQYLKYTMLYNYNEYKFCH